LFDLKLSVHQFQVSTRNIARGFDEYQGALKFAASRADAGYENSMRMNMIVNMDTMIRNAHGLDDYP
jgi:hypothetical protein